MSKISMLAKLLFVILFEFAFAILFYKYIPLNTVLSYIILIILVLFPVVSISIFFKSIGLRKKEFWVKQHQIAFQKVNVGVIIVAKDFKFRIWNDYCAKLLGYPVNEMVNNYSFDMLFHNPDDYRNIQKKLENTNFHNCAIFLKNKDGRPIPVQISLSKISGPSGDFEGLVVIILDETHQSELSREVLQMGKLVSIGELAGGIAHEVNNPLATIAINCEILIDELEAANEKVSIDYLKERLEIMHEQSFRCKKIVQKLLDFSKRHSPTLHEFNLHDLITDTVELVSYDAKQKQIKFEYDFKLDSDTVVSDPSQIMQVLLNVFNNALDASEKNSKIVIHTENVENYTKIIVEDFGGGIHADDLHKVFQPFYSTKESGKGTGLGLPICEKIITNLGGRINFTSQVSKGTKVNVLIPIKLVEGLDGKD